MTLAISVWQPHATLLARPLPSTGKAAKQFETRSWRTDYRGLIVIHAAKSQETLYLCKVEPLKSILAQLGYHDPDELPIGAALGFADLLGCFRTNDLIRTISAQEKAFGDFGPNRYGRKFDNLRYFKEPIPMRGQQGLWEFGDEYYASAEAQAMVEKE